MPLQIRLLLGLASIQWSVVLAMMILVYKIFKDSTMLRPGGLMITKVATVFAGATAAGLATSVFTPPIFCTVCMSVIGGGIIAYLIRYDKIK